jgi:hypothetical protein
MVGNRPVHVGVADFVQYKNKSNARRRQFTHASTPGQKDPEQDDAIYELG